MHCTYSLFVLRILHFHVHKKNKYYKKNATKNTGFDSENKNHVLQKLVTYRVLSLLKPDCSQKI